MGRQGNVLAAVCYDRAHLQTNFFFWTLPCNAPKEIVITDILERSFNLAMKMLKRLSILNGKPVWI